MGSCSCDDAETVTILKDTTCKAKQTYRCYECHKVIQAGERYSYIAAACQGDILTMRSCLFCNRVLKDVVNMGYCVLYGGLWDTVGQIEQGDL